MTDQNTFTEVLREVAEIIRTSGESMSEDEIMTYFSDMNLSEDQKKLVLDYLNNGIHEKNTAYEDDVKIDSHEMMEAENGQTGIDAASENSKVLQAYMEDLSLLETYEEKEIMVLYKRLFSGESETIELLTAIWLPKVLEVARKYMDIHAKLEDLIQEGNVALLLRLNQLCGTPDCSDAEKSFEDIEDGLIQVIERGIIDYISEWNSAKQQENELVGKLSLLHEADRLLEEENGKRPTDSQLAEYTNMTVDEIKELKNLLR